MESGSVTTPFGRRPMTLGMLTSQVTSRDVGAGASVDKWKIYRALCEAKPLLEISDRALTVLNALLSFYPKSELSADNSLVVFPSNAQLSLRCHGMAEQTIRRHMAALVVAGLIIRKDSPNGKRYARKNRQGEINDAYGFSLAPLLARATEIEQLAAKVAADRLYMQTLKERLTLCRRDISKLINAALIEELPGEWLGAQQRFHQILDQLPRVASTRLIASALATLETLREEIIKQLEILIKAQNSSGNDSQNERHIQITESESPFDSEAASEVLVSEFTAVNRSSAVAFDDRMPIPTGTTETPIPRADAPAAIHPLPLSLVLQACPEVRSYGPAGTIKTWQDLIAAGTMVSSMLQISPSAYKDACRVMGPQNAATVLACIFERAGEINSAGGYLRYLTKRAQGGEFAIKPMLMALARAKETRHRPAAPSSKSGSSTSAYGD
ncbi:replication initiation protein RepC [Rhizobium sp. P32RR-XVIII]|uniref:plasmid replication protein RepC n=1 Tax=Rhizobium sp. P32RR-XVIII TaxID=2726738 RepID=UPI0014571728|nr:plasmid replication protein RepC [Rhizobium sp. P32RR-XVIII]NLS03732.1 replication initiation protein RepC [Rhizobium sp. P32RR-XVIII]